jgi:protein-L-isoaspartate(D-aspartate) O-methyltransferase
MTMKSVWNFGFRRGALVLLLLALAMRANALDEEALMKAKQTMIEVHLKGRGIANEVVLKAMTDVPRYEFVPEEFRGMAYRDGPLPIGLGQTISQPYIVAAMTELLRPEADHVVFEVGTGSGYQAAVLGEIVREVYSIEIVPELGERSTALLQQLGYTNVHVRIGDGYAGWPEKAPFDGIIVTCGAEQVPPPLIEQLKPGGVMVIPVGPNNVAQELLVIEKDAEGRVTERVVMGVRFVPMTGEAMR